MKYLFFIYIMFFINCVSNTDSKEFKNSNNDNSKMEIVKNKNKLNKNEVNKDTIFRVQDLREENIDIYKKNIHLKGDLYSFNVLAITYQNIGDYESILPYAFFMAEKHNERDAYETFFTNSILILHNGDYKDEYFFELDSETQRFLKHYLKKGAKLGQSKCKSTLANLEKIAKERKIEF